MGYLLPLILAALCATVMGDTISGWQEHAKECSEKHNVPIGDIHKTLMGETRLSNDSNFKCMILCMSDKEGITKNGVLLVDALSEKLANDVDKEGIAKAIADCKDLKGTDNCDSAYKTMTCLTQSKFG